MYRSCGEHGKGMRLTCYVSNQFHVHRNQSINDNVNFVADVIGIEIYPPYDVTRIPPPHVSVN